MNLFQKTIFGVSIPVLIVCFALSITVDYFQKSPIISNLIATSITFIAIGLISFVFSKKKKSDSN